VDADLAESVLTEAFDFPNSVALSGDGALLAAGTSTGQVWLWRLADRTPLWMVQGHTGSVQRVALSADGRLAAPVGMTRSVFRTPTPDDHLPTCRATPAEPGASRCPATHAPQAPRGRAGDW